MPKIAYTEGRMRADGLAVVEQANAIIADYQAQGFTLTLRQLYYQFVSRDLIANNMKSYKRLGSIINDARLAGLIDWEAIEDRTRHVQTLSHWESPADIVSACAAQYRIDKWKDQEFRPEVWIEKEALAGVVEGVCQELDVSFLCCRGYTSQSEMWASAMRMRAFDRAGQTSIVLHFGDHDPSGIDMTRDITNRLAMFMGGVEIRRLALNMDQVEEYRPPPNPAKMTDSRFAGYVEAFGNESWELDALEPRLLADLIRQEVIGLRDDDKWAAAEELEGQHRARLQQVVKSIRRKPT
jgi:hypothetical protein